VERIEPAAENRVSGLTARSGRLYATRPASDEEVAITVRYLRPLSARKEIVLLDDKGSEVATVMEPDQLPADQRLLLRDALKERYHLVGIVRVNEVDVLFGTRYWAVETDRGPRSFALREPGKNVTWLGERHLVLRDTAGNRYEIPDVAALDARSRKWIFGSL
jgi:hypothetical protein